MFDGITLIDASLAAVVGIVVQYLKGVLPKRIIPLMPFPVAWLLAIPVVVISRGKVPPLPVMVATVFWEGLKAALMSMGGYNILKVGRGPAGKQSDQNVPNT